MALLVCNTYIRVLRYDQRQEMSVLQFLACFLLANRAATLGVDWSRTLGSTHWNGCYNRSLAPYLLDGAATVRSMGARVIKLALFAPATNYPWNSVWPDKFENVLEMVCA